MNEPQGSVPLGLNLFLTIILATIIIGDVRMPKRTSVFKGRTYKREKNPQTIRFRTFKSVKEFEESLLRYLLERNLLRSF